MADEQKPVIQDEVLLQENRNLQILQRSLAGALKEVFGEYTESQRFLDLKRIPLICKDISTIRSDIGDIKDSIKNKEGDYETRLRLLETFKSQTDGKANKNSVWLAYLFSGIGIIIGIGGLIIAILKP